MNDKRDVAAGICLMLGLFIMLGAVGGVETNRATLEENTPQMLIGLGIMLLCLPLGGAFSHGRHK